MTKQPAVSTTEISDTLVTAYADDLIELDQQIADLQGAKKRVYETIREDHGKKAAKALKLAVTVHTMDSEKRDQAEQIDVEAQRMLAIIAAPRAPRATRAREIIEEFDPETGEITEPAVPLVAAAVEAQPLDNGRDEPSAIKPVPPAPIQPETANRGEAPDVAAAGESPALENEGGENVDAGAHRAGDSDTAPAQSNIFALRTVEQLRPHCLNRTACAGHGSTHCFSCTKAHAAEIQVEVGGVQIAHHGDVA